MLNIIANWIGRIKKDKESETYDMDIDMEGGDNTVVGASVEMRLGFSFVKLEAPTSLSFKQTKQGKGKVREN